MTALEKEREELLQQLKSRTVAAEKTGTSGVESNCSQTQNHANRTARAEVCSACYERLQERLDICEAALHIDLKEAAEIIYEAVWADPNDPNRTYQNAAGALLAELRRRAGIHSMKGAFSPHVD